MSDWATTYRLSWEMATHLELYCNAGQGVCTHVDELMWLRLLVELQARRIAQLEHTAQTVAPRVLLGVAS